MPVWLASVCTGKRSRMFVPMRLVMSLSPDVSWGLTPFRVNSSRVESFRKMPRVSGS